MSKPHIGRAIKAVRLHRRMSATAVSAYAGLNEAYVAGVERGRTNPSPAALERICAVLDISQAQLEARLDD